MMKSKLILNRSGKFVQRQKGVAILDVVLAIAVFAFGMLALVQLQGGLAKSSADANQRTIAASWAEEFVETLRGYRSVTADPTNDLWEYREIVADALNTTETIGGVQYTRTVTVTNFWWDDENEVFVRSDDETPPDGLDLVYPDFKLLQLDIAWGNSDEFFVRDGQTADLGSGSITVYEIISSTPTATGAQLLSPLDGDSGPLVQYVPGENPDIVALKLNDSGTRFKESSSAQPVVFNDDAVETWFDVITYSMSGDEAVFLRREEFVAISCTCELETSPDPEDYGLTPTLWNGFSYTLGEKVNKPIGVPVNTQQSAFCGVCCRDHHDVANAPEDELYNRVDYPNGGHPHYGTDNQGNIIDTPVGDGDEYVEACRLVRKDGFMRVTQDASQATLIGFPEGYLEFPDGIAAYSDYVLESVDTYYGDADQDPSDFPQPNPPSNSPDHIFPARDEDNLLTYASLPTASLGDSQQMRARSVYVDYLTQAARDLVDDCFPASGTPTSDCPPNDLTSALEVYPFFDIQMTYLANWSDKNGSGLVDVVDEGVETDDPTTFGPEYDRGIVERRNSVDSGTTRISITSNPGNLGLTTTGRIEPDYGISEDVLFVSVNSGSTPVPPIGTIVSGNLTSSISNRVAPSKLTFESDLAICGKTDVSWSCVVPPGGATLTVTGYYLNNPTAYVCSDLSGRVENDADSTSFDLPDNGGSFNIWVTTGSCN